MKDAKGHGSNPRGNTFVGDGSTVKPGTVTFGNGSNKSLRPQLDLSAAAHQSGVNSLARGLHVDWATAKNPYSGGGFASQARARRTDKATAYIAQRAGRASNFKLTGG